MKRFTILLAVLALSLIWITPVSADGNDGIYYVSSTAYTHTGNTMANGEYPYVGVVANNFLPIGTVTKVLDGPLAGNVYVVKDRIGHSSDYDVFFDTEWECIQYGRRNIRIQVVTAEMQAKEWLHQILRDYGARVRPR